MLEKRLSKLFGGPQIETISAASGTAALAGAILVAAGRATDARPICLCPAYTFVATALAAEQCGFRIHLVDVDAQTWAIEPESLARHPQIERAGVALVTAPYGRRFSQAAWAAFEQVTGVPVVVDAAAGIEALADDAADLIGNVPLVLSLHATKAFGVGEGGAIVSSDKAFARTAIAALNFGFDDARETTVSGLNGKMSEYHAAVGLAELDGWPAKRAALRRVADRYRDKASAAGLTLHTTPDVSACYVLFEARSEPEARAGELLLSGAGIECRLWYGRGLHRNRYFSALDHDPLPNAEALAPRIIGLPVAPDLADTVVDRVVTVLAELGSAGCRTRA